MRKVPFGSLAASIAALGTVLGLFALQLRADGLEQYVDSVASASVVMYVTSALIVVTWVRARRPHSD
ncbi:hypothetical protein BIV23_41650 [Streptomyces monashensis]|uniref:Uncharacterized protein n=2 Tax=Streptomyces monashensis TaxID=1678012 RepID=A0A1S2P6M3_9ACTN|nr:SCO3870 family protein [Streptomyces monashensis]OIJ89370.1 hypothetical protein BIV23_41650 [Streptomyces monashensis]